MMNDLNLEKSPQQKVNDLESLLKTAPQVDLSTHHALSGGMYARTIMIPAGTALVGATHKTDHFDVMQGDITFTLADGETRRLTGHHVLCTKAGAKRAGFAHSDTVWTTICATDLTDIAAIEEALVVESEELQTRQLAIQRRDVQQLEAI